MLFAGNLVKHPCFDGMRYNGTGYKIIGELKNTDYVMENSFWLGVYPGMTESMLSFMIEKVTEAVVSEGS